MNSCGLLWSTAAEEICSRGLSNRSQTSSVLIMYVLTSCTHDHNYPSLLVFHWVFKFFFQILKWFTEMCAGAKHIHDQRVLHRDLKSKVQSRLGILAYAFYLMNVSSGSFKSNLPSTSREVSDFLCLFSQFSQSEHSCHSVAFTEQIQLCNSRFQLNYILKKDIQDQHILAQYVKKYATDL